MPTQLPSQVTILPQYGTDPGEIIWKSNVPGDNPWARIGGGPTACFGVAGQAGFIRFYVDQTGEAKLYGNCIPNITVLHDLGNESLRWRKLWVEDIDMTGTLTGGFVTLTTVQTISGKKTFSAPSVSVDNYKDLTLHIQDSNNHPGITLKNSVARLASWYADEDNCLVIHAENDDIDPAFRITKNKYVFVNYDAGTPIKIGHHFNVYGNSNFEGHLYPYTTGTWDIGSDEQGRWHSINALYGHFHGPWRGGHSFNVEIRDTIGDHPGIIFQRYDAVDCGAIESTTDWAFKLYSKDAVDRFNIRQDGHIYTYGLAVVGEDPINFNADDFISIRMSVNNIKKARYSAGDTMCLAVQNRDDTFVFCADQYGKIYVGEPIDDYTQNQVQIHKAGLTIGFGAGMNGYPTGHAGYPAQILMKGYNNDYAITMDDGTGFASHYANCYYDGGANFKFGTSVGGASRFVIAPGSFSFQVSTTPASRGANIQFRSCIEIDNLGNVLIPGLVIEGSGMVTLTTTQTISGSKTFTGTTNLLTTHFIPENPLGGEGGQFSFDGAPGYSNIQVDSVQNYLRIWTFDGQEKIFEIRNHSGPSFHMNVFGNIYSPYTITGANLVQSLADIYATGNLRGMHVHLERNAYPSIWFHCDSDINGPTDWRIYGISNSALILRNRLAQDPFGFSQGGLLNIVSTTETWAINAIRGIAIGANSPHPISPGLYGSSGYATLDLSENAPRYCSISFHNTGRSVMMLYLDAGYNLHVGCNNTTPFSFCINNNVGTDIMIDMSSYGHITAKGNISGDVLVVNHKSTGNAGGGIEIKHHDQQRGVWTAGDGAAFSVQSYGVFRMVVLHDGKLLVNKTSDNGTGTYLQVQGGAYIAGALSVDNLLNVQGNGNTIIQSYTGNFRITSDGGFHSQYMNATNNYQLRGTEIINYNGQFLGSVSTAGTIASVGYINTSSGYQVNGVVKIDSQGVYRGSVQCYDNVFGTQFGIMGQYVGRTQYFNIGGQILNFVGGILV